jgi:two-component system, NtrC family, nitrogen regulation sensor histidine kinase NtrY
VTLRGRFALYLVIVHMAAAALAVAWLHAKGAWLLLAEVLLFCSLAAGFLLLRRLFGAFAFTREASQLLADGDFMSRFRPVGQPELDRLIELYNRMSDRLRTERVRLEEQQQFLTRIMAVSPLGIVLLSFDGEIAYVNPAGERLLQQPAPALLGKPLREVPGALAETLVRLGDGDSTVVPLWGGRRARCQRGAFVDRGFARSFMVVEELTEELRQFERAAYGKLIRMMSHEVNNSVGASNSLLHSCLNYTADLPPAHRADFESALSIAIGRTDHLNAFMRTFADVIRLPAPRCEPGDVSEMLGRIERLTRSQRQQRGIAWQTVVEAPIPPVSMDVAQMEQVLVNVVKNAIEAIEHDGLITVRLGQRDGRPAVVVEDSGPGLSAEARQNLFTPFFSTKEHGQGIGLTLVQEILSQHRFRYSLDSPADGLTEFTIVF